MNSLLTRSALALALGSAMLAPSAFAMDASLKTDKDKHSYMIGMTFGMQLKDFKDDVDVALIQKAMADGLAGKTLMTEAEMQQVSNEFRTIVQKKREEARVKAAGENKAKGDEFLAKNKTAAGVKTTESGLQYSVIKEGSGAKPKATDQVKVHYVGTLINGTKFDSSIDRGQPATFPLNGVIPGWTEGLQLMSVGSKYKFVIPGNLAYGEQGQPQGGIGPNEVLIFEVELLEILN
ncbi:MAG: FKBP-type peptidyl-prolyl cis-trans isomerase [Xanthomonadales bacterium]|nr:Outer membrane protein MIP [Xanthomonadales bacterium]MCC6593563.1 FKBP-type peptidyl-prolyl cis-trans isomerase [Xanthomonadales bacterium]MCE7932285.1 FKBP-type peptidyl-prolyl cis-trans isomerase [Xanthomonadales bacterium PRO6]